MKKLIASLLLTIIISLLYGQTESISVKSVADSFELYYNSNNFKAIFERFSPEMQNASPAEKTTDFFKGLMQQSGKILRREFVKFDQSFASYKTKFENALFTLNISVDKQYQINGLYIEPFKPDNLPKLKRNTSSLILPFKDEWTVIWGGDTKELNHHIESEAQKNAFDILITDDKGKSFRTDGKSNKDYYAFGKELIAPCDGEIISVVDGIKDNLPGNLNPSYIPGNTVIIKTNENEYLFFAHLKQYSITVKQGQKIKQGQVLGFCGNSGNSSEPHLHFHIQNVEDFNVATGVKCFFEKIKVNGVEKTDYSPVQKDKIRNVL